MAPASGVPVPAPLDSCQALLAYDGAAREVVTGLKYRNARAAADWLALGVAGLVDGLLLDIVTWAPTTAARRQSRGFDHAEVLARRVAARLHVPCVALLARLPGPPQTGRTLRDRRHGPRFLARRALGGHAVLVVDDVVTTGATLAAAGAALTNAGAGAIHGVAAAHPR